MRFFAVDLRRQSDETTGGVLADDLRRRSDETTDGF
jgi:hypothetical protein